MAEGDPVRTDRRLGPTRQPPRQFPGPVLNTMPEPLDDIQPLSLANAPSLIESVWPAQKISKESEVERKSVAGQTLTGLGGYWKGRKPLILNRACILGALLPATADPEGDLAVFEAIMLLDDDGFVERGVDNTAADYAKLAVEHGHP